MKFQPQPSVDPKTSPQNVAKAADTGPGWGSSRPSVKQEKLGGDNAEMNKWIGRYLGVGETVLDLAITTAGQSGWFERTR